MTMNKLFLERAKDFYGSNRIVYQWSRKASEALRRNDTVRFNECMCLAALWEHNYYMSKHYARHRALESWKNYVFHLRNHNREFYAE